MSDFDDNTTFEDETSPEESSNRTFLLVAGVLGGLVLLAILCLVAYFIFSGVTNQQADATANAQLTRQAATIQIGLTNTAIGLAVTQTAALTNTVPPTSTPVIVPDTMTPSGTPNPATVTVAAGFTQISLSTQTLIETSSPTLIPTGTESALFQPVAYEEDRLGGYLPSDLRVGSIRYQHPAHMEPETSGVFYVSIFIPIDKLSVVSVPLITTPSNTPQPLGSDFTTWEGEITVAPKMKAELTSLDFKVQPEFNQSIKAIDMRTGNFTLWSWSIKSSNQASVQILYLKIYLGDAAESLWEQTIAINVQFPTATPSNTATATFTPSPTLTPSLTPTSTPTSTPIPIPQQFLNGLINNPAPVFGAILTFITAMLGYYFLYVRPKKEKPPSEPTEKEKK